MKTITHNAIERFVRQELGCQCPAAVFRRIGVEDVPEEFGVWPQGRLISVGEKLLILVVRSDDPDTLHRMLGNLLLKGRRLREARGFNRFRLVIATTSADVMGPSLRENFERLHGMDERLHLHVISPEQVPANLA
ncbi:MAG: hypothetical protein WCH04_18035 [Gammaproteobacteria bacterium]